jgi:hypothetical protein
MQVLHVLHMAELCAGGTKCGPQVILRLKLVRDASLPCTAYTWQNWVRAARIMGTGTSEIGAGRMSYIDVSTKCGMQGCAYIARWQNGCGPHLLQSDRGAGRMSYIYVCTKCGT